MSFVSTLGGLPLEELSRLSETATAADVESALARGERRGLADFAALISSAAAAYLEPMARESHALTVKHFGKVIRLFAPLYLSNECVNACQYCGFSHKNPIRRSTLTIDQAQQEAGYLVAEGFRNILLVTGEHPKFSPVGYVRDCVAALHQAGVPSIHIEVAPMETDGYRSVAEAGGEGLVCYQETYNRQVYATMHPTGPKKDFEWRLETAERAAAAGFKRLGIGALLGLAPWRAEAISMAAHAEHLLRHCWRSQLTVSFPRLRPAAGAFNPLYPVTDRQYVQLICALRLTFPRVGLVLSTRETARLRDGLIPLGITLMSAGSHTEPGGYTGAGNAPVPLVEPGKPESIPLIDSEGEHGGATEQFAIADERSAAEVASKLHEMGYEAVWKDWDAALSGSGAVKE